MQKKERLYLGLGILAYAVAKADGKVNLEEREKLHQIVEQNVNCNQHDIDISEIIFRILEKYDSMNLEQLYQMGMKEINLVSDELTNDMRSDFPATLEKVARAFHPITEEENAIIERFRKDINQI
jgi:uncharacterized tellurite resistance protein B-like protein